jgi:methylglutaconyl-CoA hydratase
MSFYRKILYAVDAHGIARVTLNRPEKRNALDGELIHEIKDAVQACTDDATVRVVVLAGAGADFCSGADLSGLQKTFEAGPLENMADARKMADLFVDMRKHRCPIIAAVRGRALAGGCGLATAADIILAAESAQFGYPEVNIGFIPAMVMAILRRSVSEKRAFELITTGEIVTATAALEYGMINRVFADETFDIDVDAFASKLASKSASAVSLSKNLLYHMDTLGFEAAIEAGVQANAIARMTDDCRRGIERFLKKTGQVS